MSTTFVELIPFLVIVSRLAMNDNNSSNGIITTKDVQALINAENFFILLVHKLVQIQ
jgi:hypothetical protein